MAPIPLILLIMAALDPSPLAPGRFGLALDAQGNRPAAKGRDAYVTPPLTVECWALVRSKGDYNLLVANEPKTSGTHWELYTAAGTGCFSIYLPGYGADIRSNRDVTDGQWHHLAMVLEPTSARLYVDAEIVAAQDIQRGEPARQDGPLVFGTAPGAPQLGCDGLVDEVRISSGVRSLGAVPVAPFTPDARTIGLWHFDAVDEHGVMPDSSSLANPAIVTILERVSMDEADRREFQPGPSPIESPLDHVTTYMGGVAARPEGPPVLALDGEWQMAEGGDEGERLTTAWPEAIPATVPGSVHTALATAGRIPDPKFDRNDSIAHAQSFKTWWFKRTFPRPAGSSQQRLVFDGVAIRCTVWLNGERLGSHDGMFGGPSYEVGPLLRNENQLVVKLDPAPGDPAAWNNPAWRETVVFNNVWGWHYSSIPALGIWRSVRLESAPFVRLTEPFVTTRKLRVWNEEGDDASATVDVVVKLEGPSQPWAGWLTGIIEPLSRSRYGAESDYRYRLSRFVRSDGGDEELHFQVSLFGCRPWWPNDLGQPFVYGLTLWFVPNGTGQPDRCETTFGIRTIEMAPLPNGPRADQYNWTFVINGRPTFIKGAGWCTMDSSMDFSRERYDRFLSLAKQQHVQMLRCWGSGMPETDDFYDLCDHYGILVLQEWPTAWNSHAVQPYDVLEETVRLNTLRIRNHPSLAMYGAGNESGDPTGPAIDMMGRYATELDGTRPFHRAEPWGGSQHNYNCYWGRQPLDHNVRMTAPFFGEFGLACMPVYESVLRYLPADERDLWPPPADGSLVHHTPIFGKREDWERLTQYSGYFTPPANLATFITGSQLSQAVGLRHTLELARTRWPDCSGALYYKMNDNYPAASWSTADWYGAPKIGHYFCQDAFAPLKAAVLFDALDVRGQAVAWPINLLDDANQLLRWDWTVTVEAWDGQLRRIKAVDFEGQSVVASPHRLGTLKLSGEQTATAPLFVVAEVRRGGRLADRTFYFVNYESPTGCLFTLPNTTLAVTTGDGVAKVTNTGRVPAVGVSILRPGHLDTFVPEDNYFWLAPGESRAVKVSDTDGLTVGAWNAGDRPTSTSPPPDPPTAGSSSAGRSPSAAIAAAHRP